MASLVADYDSDDSDGGVVATTDNDAERHGKRQRTSEHPSDVDTKRQRRDGDYAAGDEAVDASSDQVGDAVAGSAASKRLLGSRYAAHALFHRRATASTLTNASSASGMSTEQDEQGSSGFAQGGAEVSADLAAPPHGGHDHERGSTQGVYGTAPAGYPPFPYGYGGYPPYPHLPFPGHGFNGGYHQPHGGGPGGQPPDALQQPAPASLVPSSSMLASMDRASRRELEVHAVLPATFVDPHAAAHAAAANRYSTTSYAADDDGDDDGGDGDDDNDDEPSRRRGAVITSISGASLRGTYVPPVPVAGGAGGTKPRVATKVWNVSAGEVITEVEPSAVSKKKHQIGFLAVQAASRLQAEQVAGSGGAHRVMPKGKYGW